MIAEELGVLLANTLFVNSPVLSGNMKAHIKIVEQSENKMVIEVSAKFYDMNRWRKSKAVVFTGKSYNGITDYPMWVNESGGFNTHNQSEGWANRTIKSVCEAIANKYGGVVVDELGL